MKIGIIAGSGIEDLSLDLGPDVKFKIIPRHGKRHEKLPHEIDYRSNIMALKKFGAEYILSTSAVGSLHHKFKPGDFLVLSDFIDFTKHRPLTLGGKGAVLHPDMSNPYDNKINNALKIAIKKVSGKKTSEAVYIAVEGPRFETKAEIRMYSRLGGDVVGMTNVPEVVFAAEAGIPYGSIAIVTNFACGISKDPISHDEVEAMMKRKKKEISEIIRLAINLLDRTDE